MGDTTGKADGIGQEGKGGSSAASAFASAKVMAAIRADAGDLGTELELQPAGWPSRLREMSITSLPQRNRIMRAAISPSEVSICAKPFRISTSALARSSSSWSAAMPLILAIR